MKVVTLFLTSRHTVEGLMHEADAAELIQRHKQFINGQLYGEGVRYDVDLGYEYVPGQFGIAEKAVHLYNSVSLNDVQAVHLELPDDRLKGYVPLKYK